MANERLIPAPLDNRNVTTDWIENLFDEYHAMKENNCYVGFYKGIPMVCDFVLDNQAIFYLVCSGRCWGLEMLHQLYLQLKEITSQMEGLKVKLKEDKDQYCVSATFFFA